VCMLVVFMLLPVLGCASTCQVIGWNYLYCVEWDVQIYYLYLTLKQSTCIAPCMVQNTLKRSGMDHTAFNLQKTPCQPLLHKRSPDGASTECVGGHLIAAHCSFIDPQRMKG